MQPYIIGLGVVAGVAGISGAVVAAGLVSRRYRKRQEAAGESPGGGGGGSRFSMAVSSPGTRVVRLAPLYPREEADGGVRDE